MPRNVDTVAGGRGYRRNLFLGSGVKGQHKERVSWAKSCPYRDRAVCLCVVGVGGGGWAGGSAVVSKGRLEGCV